MPCETALCPKGRLKALRPPRRWCRKATNNRRLLCVDAAELASSELLRKSPSLADGWNRQAWELEALACRQRERLVKPASRHFLPKAFCVDTSRRVQSVASECGQTGFVFCVSRCSKAELHRKRLWASSSLVNGELVKERESRCSGASQILFANRCEQG